MPNKPAGSIPALPSQTMKTNQFQELIQAVTNRPLTLDTKLEEIPLLASYEL
jgi:hypothetical protein